MTIPSYRDVDLAVLLELVRSPTPLRAVDAVQRVVRHFPQLTEEDLAQTRSDGRTKAFPNMVRWGREHVRVRGLLVAEMPGLWAVNEKARAALVHDLVQKGLEAGRAGAFVDSDQSLADVLGPSWAWPVTSKSIGSEAYGSSQTRRAPKVSVPGVGISDSRAAGVVEAPLGSGDLEGTRKWAKQEIIHKLNTLAGYEFEQLIARVLDGLGFRDTQVTGRSGDEGVDLITWLWSPLVSAKVAVQVKRHSGNVGPRDISYLRDRWAHRADRLMFITTSDYTIGAREVAAEDRDKDVRLVNGEELAEVMLDHGLGARTEPQVMYLLDDDFFAG